MYQYEPQNATIGLSLRIVIHLFFIIRITATFRLLLPIQQRVVVCVLIFKDIFLCILIDTSMHLLGTSSCTKVFKSKVTNSKQDIHSAVFVLDPHNLGIRCLVNGETVQSSNTDQMIFKTAELVTWVSK